MASKEYIGIARLTEVFGYILAKLLTVKNQSGTALTKRFVMKFKDISVSDNSTSGETEVEAFHAISSESELTNAGDGAYIGTYDEETDEILDASMVAYGNETVEDALDDLQPKGSVSVTADGVKTAAELLNELYAKTDWTKISGGSYLKYIAVDGTIFYIPFVAKVTTYYYFIGNVYYGGSYLYTHIYKIGSSSSEFLAKVFTTSITEDHYTNNVQTSGIIFSVYY